MPPKKKVAKNVRAVWSFRNDFITKDDSDPNGWTPYPLADSDTIEVAYGFGGAKALATVGTYIVDTRKLRQHLKGDTSKERAVRRVEVPIPTAIESADTEDEKTPVAAKVLRAGAIALVGPAPSAAVQEMLRAVPAMNRMSLSEAANKMRPLVRKWLVDMGRDAAEAGQVITVAVPIAALNPRKAYSVGPFALKHKEMVEMGAAAKVTYVKGLVTEPVAVIVPKGTALDDVTETSTQLYMVSGPCHVMFDNDYNAMRRAAGAPPPPPVMLYSIPGINFAYSGADLAAFTATTEDGVAIVEPKAFDRMVTIWAHVLLVMAADKVVCPVLCAIGCGAFKGRFGTKVPLMWARALCHVLCSDAYRFAFESVLVSLPVFGSDDNFTPFKRAFEGKATCCPVVLVEDAGMMTMAHHLSTVQGKTVGVLNPSDVLAIRRGHIGMFWDKGHIALEEILAMQTTLLLHHVGLNGSLYTDRKRWHAIEIRH